LRGGVVSLHDPRRPPPLRPETGFAVPQRIVLACAIVQGLVGGRFLPAGLIGVLPMGLALSLGDLGTAVAAVLWLRLSAGHASHNPGGL
jgi:hypothetical protein